jgi:hypothetical protein
MVTRSQTATNPHAVCAVHRQYGSVAIKQVIECLAGNIVLCFVRTVGGIDRLRKMSRLFELELDCVVSFKLRTRQGVKLLLFALCRRLGMGNLPWPLAAKGRNLPWPMSSPFNQPRLASVRLLCPPS